ncbi:hypothetical protein DSO57_1003594 [Entomophthora muscae]|uniref:Uncharacterized protein n=1 Tax=Entomophthora muscae TaxID=34485 RepID=A0ACC2TW14_9FUNG|nr:hypothetical protein DSO57_1003594 [Entomophthora muscae]
MVNQARPHIESWRPLATVVNYLIRIAPIVHMAFQARPASPVGVQLGSAVEDPGNSCLLFHYPGMTLIQFDGESFM